MAKQNKKQPIREENTTPNLSLILLFPHDLPDISVLSDSIGKIKDRNMEALQVVSVFNGSSAPVKAKLLSDATYNRMDHTEMDIPSGELSLMISTGIAAAKNSLITVLFPSELTKPLQLNELITYKWQDESAPVLFPSFAGRSYDNPVTWDGIPLFTITKELAGYLFGQLMPQHFSMNRMVTYLEKLGIVPGLLHFNQSDPFSFAHSKKRFNNWKERRAVSFRWFISVPLKELKHKRPVFLTQAEPSVYRLIFVITAFILFIAFPLLSFHAGISGDEEVNYVHAGYVYNYYHTLGKDTTCLNTPATRLQYYGQSFDNFTYLFNKTFHIEKIYESRHIFNAWTGWLTVLFSGLIAALLAGWRAGLITMLLMFISPVFLGHSLNNPKDVPFALGYIWSLYGTLLFLKDYPRIRWSRILLLVLGIAFAISVRAGGLLLIVYLCFFSGLYFLITSSKKSFFSPVNMKRMKHMIIAVLLISLAGYITGLLWWPYALQNPFRNPFISLKLMTNFDASLRQVFEGKFVWSDNLPWYYIPKYILISIPLIVVVGLALFILYIKPIVKKYNRLFLFMMVFAWFFPVAYVINKASNVYGSWRHLLFVYPPIVVTAAIALNHILNQYRNKYVHAATVVLMLGFCYHPVRHIIVNHPLEYVYYNEIAGGVDHAYGRYETDYYFHSLREGSLWLKQELLKEGNTGDTVIVASNFLPAIRYYFRDMPNRVKVTYTRYYERGESNWDYGIYACSYMNPYQLKKGYYPPHHTIHTVNVDDIPVCAVVKRTSKDDYIGTRYLEKDQYGLARDYFLKALEDNPDNEVALMNISRMYIEAQHPDSSIEYIRHLLKVYPDYDKGLNMLGVAYLSENQLNSAMNVFERITRVNPKFVTAYFNLGLVAIRMNNPTMAEKYFRKAIEVNRIYKPSYLALAELWQRMGKTSEAQELLEIARTLP